MGRHIVRDSSVRRHKARADSHLYRRRVRTEACAIDWNPMPGIIEPHQHCRIAARRDDSIRFRILLERVVLEEFTALRVRYTILAIHDVRGSTVRFAHGRRTRQRFDMTRTLLAGVAVTSDAHDRSARKRQRDSSARTLGQYLIIGHANGHVCFPIDGGRIFYALFSIYATYSKEYQQGLSSN